MNLKTFIAQAAILMVGTPAFAAGILCSLDARPVDGNYGEVRLAETAQGYEITQTTASSGFGRGGAAPSKTSRVLATGLQCSIDGLAAYCFKSGTQTGESANSIATFEVVQKLQIQSLQDKTATMSEPRVVIEVSSPITGQRQKYDFAVKAQFGGCKSL